jgi:hypothetical protein
MMEMFILLIFKKKIKFDEFNENQSVQEEIPVIIGVDGGAPNSIINNASYSELTLLDGGEIVQLVFQMD